MKEIIVSALLVAVVFLQPAASRASGATSSALSAGAIYHAEHSVFTDLPFADGDIGYQLAYEYRDGNACWQLAAEYAPDVTGTNTVDYVITPQLNFFLLDGGWRFGVGALGSYLTEKAPGDSDWTDVYWQFIAGLEIPVGRLNLGADALYRFEKWGELSDFDFGDIEFGGWISYRF